MRRLLLAFVQGIPPQNQDSILPAFNCVKKLLGGNAGLAKRFGASRLLIARAPEIRGSLGIGGNLKARNERVLCLFDWELLQVQFRGFLEISNRLVNGAPLAHGANFGAIGHE
jgi:hypothetical protein